MSTTVESITIPFIKMKEKEAKPVPGYFIYEDETGDSLMTAPVLIPIKQNVEDRTETWKGYIKVEKSERHYFRIDGDDILTLNIPPGAGQRPIHIPSWPTPCPSSACNLCARHTPPPVSGFSTGECPEWEPQSFLWDRPEACPACLQPLHCRFP